MFIMTGYVVLVRQVMMYWFVKVS